jgi:hypothetical protein
LPKLQKGELDFTESRKRRRSGWKATLSVLMTLSTPPQRRGGRKLQHLVRRGKVLPPPPASSFIPIVDGPTPTVLTQPVAPTRNHYESASARPPPPPSHPSQPPDRGLEPGPEPREDHGDDMAAEDIHEGPVSADHGMDIDLMEIRI